MNYTLEQYIDFTVGVAKVCEMLDDGIQEILANNPDNMRAVGALSVIDAINEVFDTVFKD